MLIRHKSQWTQLWLKMVDMCTKHSTVVLTYKFIFEDWGECPVGGL